MSTIRRPEANYSIVDSVLFVVDCSCGQSSGSTFTNDDPELTKLVQDSRRLLHHSPGDHTLAVNEIGFSRYLFTYHRTTDGKPELGITCDGCDQTIQLSHEKYRHVT